MNNTQRILKHPASPILEDPESLTVLCKATADSARLKILRILRTDSLGVMEMSKILGVRQSALSHHLKVLANAGLVSSRRESNAIFYRRVFLEADDPLSSLKASVFETVDRIRLEPELAYRLFEVKQERARQSREFFTRFTDKFKQNQLLVATPRHYSTSLKDLLAGLKLPADSTALEVGPGAGELLPLLGREFNRVVALDNSEEMLAKARVLAEKRDLRNIDFVHGDTGTGVEKGLRADLAVISMVLHHVASPADVFLDVSRMLNDGGVVLVVELCRHNQDWVREACGDLWLGFEPEELSNWAHNAGMQSGQSLYLGLKNGFQIQMHLFHKKNSNL